MDVPVERFLAWPPFYTLQPNLDTRSQQLYLWTQILLEYSQKNRIYIATSHDFHDIMRNNEVSRSLSEEFKNVLFDYMLKQKNAIREGEAYMIFWKKPEAWGEQVYRWAVDSGRVGSVETVEGLVSGDETTREEFYGMPVNYMMVILRSLEKSRKAELFQVGEGMAVKFF
ncbi:unnamed protein product [Blepharisma stoltei]|uniref:Vacuolar protein-sorting-associated protein 25 n=1 Tax=Blepharisma stoltei TaxID=1481888 RepID=A0AAU9J507_9CILI|nr:unnamed protein product [Blepharisma stoltei]